MNFLRKLERWKCDRSLIYLKALRSRFGDRSYCYYYLRTIHDAIADQHGKSSQLNYYRRNEVRYD